MGDPAKANDKIGAIYCVSFYRLYAVAKQCREDKYDAYSSSVTEGHSTVNGFCNMT